MNYKEKFEYLKGKGTITVRSFCRSIPISPDTFYKYLAGMDILAAKKRAIEKRIDELMEEARRKGLVGFGGPIRVEITPPQEDKEDHRITDIINLLREDPEGTDAVFHFLEAKKNFDRASKSMKQYLGKKLETWFEFPAGNDDKGKKEPDM